MTAPRWSSAYTVGRLCVDTCIIVGRSDPTRFVAIELPALTRLFEHYEEHRVMLAKTDTVDVERTHGQPADVVESRLLETFGMLEVLGPLVLGSSRLGHTVLGSQEDNERIDEILAIVHPHASRSNAKSRRDVRDALHLATAIRDGFDGFVSTDGPIVDSAAAIRERWPLFTVFTPSGAVKWIDDALARSR